MTEPAPKLFISYSWTLPEHEQWVLDVATDLRQDGVDVILDKWDLKEGLEQLLRAFTEGTLTILSWGLRTPQPSTLMGFDQIATLP